jgi:predicted secreted protein
MLKHIPSSIAIVANDAQQKKDTDPADAGPAQPPFIAYLTLLIEAVAGSRRALLLRQGRSDIRLRMDGLAQARDRCETEQLTAVSTSHAER